jgi:microcystin-dependent protein
MDCYLGMIVPFAFNFTPQYFMPCDGRLLPISQYAALYSLLGTTYGGDGHATFGLPDLRGRFPLGANSDASLQTRFNTASQNSGGSVAANKQTGNATGAALISSANLPAHTHAASFTPVASPVVPPSVTIKVSKDTATSSAPPDNAYIATAAAGGANQPKIYSTTNTAGVTALNSGSVTVTGGSGGMTGGIVSIASTGSTFDTQAPVSATVTVTPPPYLAVQFFICVMGIYPSRN